MNPRLVKSALLSVLLHGFLCLPGLPGFQRGRAPEADVVRGESSVELVLQTASEWEADRGEVIVPEPQRWEAPPSGGTSLDRSFREGDTGAIRQAKPISLQNPAPRYPWPARLRGWEGTVVIRARLNSAGTPGRVAVVRSSGRRILDEAASAALAGWRFVPARENGRPVASQVEVPITFRLKSRDTNLFVSPEKRR